MRLLNFMLFLLFSAQVWAFSPSDLRAFGTNSEAQLYLFTSLGCVHCVDFHKKVLPDLKKEYVDTNKVQLIIVDVIRGADSLIATQALRCLDVPRASKLEDDLYANQSKWLGKNQAESKKVIASYALKQGMDQKLFNLCTTDKNLQEAIMEQQANLGMLYEITGTPTLVLRQGNVVRKWMGSDKKEILKGLKEAFE